MCVPLTALCHQDCYLARCVQSHGTHTQHISENVILRIALHLLFTSLYLCRLVCVCVFVCVCLCRVCVCVCVCVFALSRSRSLSLSLSRSLSLSLISSRPRSSRESWRSSRSSIRSPGYETHTHTRTCTHARTHTQINKTLHVLMRSADLHKLMLVFLSSFSVISCFWFF